MNDSVGNGSNGDLKTFPPYKNALEEIVKITTDEGYGVLFTHEQLNEWMDMKEPETIEEYKKFEFERLSAIEPLKAELLVDYSIFLSNEVGQGYRVLEPDEQVTSGVDRYLKKAQRTVLKSMQVLVHVAEDMLSLENQSLRLRKMERAAFLQAAFRKRKIPSLKGKVQELSDDPT